MNLSAYRAKSRAKAQYGQRMANFMFKRASAYPVSAGLFKRRAQLGRARRVARTSRRANYFGHNASATLRGAGDHKFVDTAAAGYVNDTTGTITHITIVPQGSTVNGRLGDCFAVTAVRVRGLIYAGTTATFNNYMNLLVWDYEPKKVLPAITDILDAANAGSLPKRENQGRFRILKVWHGVLSGNTVTPATGDELCDVDDFVKCPKGLVARCTDADTTGAIGNRLEGAMYFVTVGNNAAGTTAATTSVFIRVNHAEI